MCLPTLLVIEEIHTSRSVAARHACPHGMVQPFALKAHEVDFVYVTCAAGARFFTKL